MDKKKIIQTGMVASAAVSAVTAFNLEDSFSKKVHITSLVALAGFAFWNQLEKEKSDNRVKEGDSVSKEQNYSIEINSFVAEVAIKGKLSGEELKTFESKVEELLELYSIGSINILVDIRELKGIELRGVWEDLTFYLRHKKEFNKAAIVGNRKLEEYIISVADKFVSTEMKHFKEYDEAKEWIVN